MTTATPLTVNGKPQPADGIKTLGELLASLDIRPQRVVVELNGEIHRRGQLPRSGSVRRFRCEPAPA